MRDFREAKRMAASLRKALGQAELTVSHSHSLELIAKAFGVENWNVLAARIGEAVIAALGRGTAPFGEPWARWRADPARGTPELPADRATVPAYD